MAGEGETVFNIAVNENAQPSHGLLSPGHFVKCVIRNYYITHSSKGIYTREVCNIVKQYSTLRKGSYLCEVLNIVNLYFTSVI